MHLPLLFASAALKIACRQSRCVAGEFAEVLNSPMHKAKVFARRVTLAISSCRNFSGLSHLVATLKNGTLAEESAAKARQPVSPPRAKLK